MAQGTDDLILVVYLDHHLVPENFYHCTHNFISNIGGIGL